MRRLPFIALVATMFAAACEPSGPPVDPDLAADGIEALSEPSDGAENEPAMN